MKTQILSFEPFYKEVPEEIKWEVKLDRIPIEEIEKYLRKKKLNNIKNKKSL